MHQRLSSLELLARGSGTLTKARGWIGERVVSNLKLRFQTVGCVLDGKVLHSFHQIPKESVTQQS